MIGSGDTLHNPVTGETRHFVTAAADTNGEYVLVEATIEPDGFVAAQHMHPFQTEVFEVVEGTVEVKAGGKTVVAGPGEKVVVEPGTAHKFRNAGDTVARFRCEVRPALQFEQLIETMFALANDGRTNRRGMPNPMRLAAIANHHFDDVRLPFPPVWMQRLGLAFGAPIARLLGSSATGRPTSPPSRRARRSPSDAQLDRRVGPLRAIPARKAHVCLTHVRARRLPPRPPPLPRG